MRETDQSLFRRGTPWRRVDLGHRLHCLKLARLEDLSTATVRVMRADSARGSADRGVISNFDVWLATEDLGPSDRFGPASCRVASENPCGGSGQPPGRSERTSPPSGNAIAEVMGVLGASSVHSSGGGFQPGTPPRPEGRLAASSRPGGRRRHRFSRQCRDRSHRIGSVEDCRADCRLGSAGSGSAVDGGGRVRVGEFSTGHRASGRGAGAPGTDGRP